MFIALAPVVLNLEVVLKPFYTMSRYLNCSDTETPPGSPLQWFAIWTNIGQREPHLYSETEARRLVIQIYIALIWNQILRPPNFRDSISEQILSEYLDPRPLFGYREPSVYDKILNSKTNLNIQNNCYIFCVPGWRFKIIRSEIDIGTKISVNGVARNWFGPLLQQTHHRQC